ncbi:MAG: 2,3-bisphosphoglycerate-independent phosphoglycerate mutase, partial [Candidatus Nanohaloarchaeota archaeon QJJ-7]|nr:2,3-bisphosphoglycerate-independent phosphoglycerate mutase [Candidatus Nanohaloarchaeota archaeon QJJ-7]
MDGVVLAVLDGLGVRKGEDGNAFLHADTPNLDRLFSENPYTELRAWGEAVGLPEGYIGNSEVGHLHIGSGRVVTQELVRINKLISEGKFPEKEALKEAAEEAKRKDSRVHVMGIASDGGVHGHVNHILALMEFFADRGCEVETHAFLDGRDVPPESASGYLEQIQEKSEEVGNGSLGSFMGRYYSMDRDDNWDRTEKAYRALISGEGHRAEDWEEGLEDRYEDDRNDYFVEPVILEGFEPVEEGDVVVFSNWREDRARQLTRAFIQPDFGPFETDDPEKFYFVSMMPYEDHFDNPSVLEEEIVEPTLGEILSENGRKELRLTESQKEPHVTYFFDGQREEKFPGTDTKIFESADLPSYDRKPEMESGKITEYAEEAMMEGEHDFILINYPNCDLVSHTGDLDAAVEAVETVDEMAGRLEEKARENDYTLILTSDHGNCEEMTGEFETSHTLNPVPFCLVNGPEGLELEENSGLVNIAPAVLQLMGLQKPSVM